MGMSPSDIKVALEMLDSFDELKPLIPVALQKLHDFGELVRPSLESFVDTTIDLQARAVKRLVANHGFTNDEAIAIVTSLKKGMADGMRSGSK